MIISKTVKEIFNDFWFDFSIWFDTNIKYPYRGIKNYFKNIIRYSDILYSDKDWDYDFFLNIVDKKLEFMENYHKSSKICEENSWIYSRIKLTRKLLYIARELESEEHERYYTPYVNIRNSTRFVPTFKKNILNISKDILQRKLYNLRIRKAWILYNEMLKNYTESWWD